MIEERHALNENNTWDLINLPKIKKVAGYKCMFLVDYSDIFYPMTTKVASIRLFISIPLH